MRAFYCIEKISKVSLVILFLYGFLVESYGQGTKFTATLDSVVVEIGRDLSNFEISPFSLSKIESDKLQFLSNSLTVKEILNGVPGVFVSTRFNLAQGDKILIRGIGSRAQFGVRGIKILLDDIPLTFPDGQSQLNNLDPASIGQVEVLRGPSSALYGNSAGGVISIKSLLSTESKWIFNPKFTSGSYNFYKFSIGASGKLLNGSAGINLYRAKYGGFRAFSNAKYSGLNFIMNQNLSQKISLSAVANYYNSPYLMNPGSLNKDDATNNPRMARDRMKKKGTGKNINQIQTGLSIKYNFSKATNLSATIYGINRDLFNSIPTRLIELQRYSYGIRSVFSFRPNFLQNRIKFLAGIDYEIQDDSRIEFVNEGLDNSATVNVEDILDNLNYGEKLLDQNEFVKSIGVFSKLGFNIFNNLNLSVGIRYDRFIFRAGDRFFNDGKDNSGEKKMNHFSPLAGLSLRLSNSFIFYGNYSSSFQTPTTNELSNRPDGNGGFNKSLKPEEFRTLEVGVRGATEEIRLSYNVAFFLMNIDNMIVPYQNANEEDYYKNSGKTESKGIELSLRWNPVNPVIVDFSYTLNEMKFLEFSVEDETGIKHLSGNYVPGVPKYNLHLSMTYYSPFGLILKARLNSVGKIYTNDYNGLQPGDTGSITDYINESNSVINFSAAYSFNIDSFLFDLHVGVENIFDKRYNGSIVPNSFGNYYFEPASGRTIYATLQTKI